MKWILFSVITILLSSCSYTTIDHPDSGLKYRNFELNFGIDREGEQGADLGVLTDPVDGSELKEFAIYRRGKESAGAQSELLMRMFLLGAQSAKGAPVE